VKQRFPVSTYIGVVVVRASGPGLVRIGTVTRVHGFPRNEFLAQNAFGQVPNMRNLDKRPRGFRSTEYIGEDERQRLGLKQMVKFGFD